MPGSPSSRIAALAALSIGAHLYLRFVASATGEVAGFALPVVPLLVALAAGGVPLVLDLAKGLVHGRFGSDILAGISIVTSIILGEYLAGTLVVLMLSGGQTIEQYAVASASSALRALAKRLPASAHRRREGVMADVPLDAVAVGDELVVFPHEACPVDGVVLDGRSTMDESYLTGEPYFLAKAPGASVLSGAVNGEGALTIRAEKTAVDSRYTKIMQVMRESEISRPHLRRLGDQLGALNTPVAVGIAVIAWALTGDPMRFLAVLVVATPCPLLIAIPVAIIGSVSLAAERSIIIRDPAVLERIDTCRTAIFDKTGTLTYGQPTLTDIVAAPGVDTGEVLGLAASVERYSRHPLASAVTDRAKQDEASVVDASEVSERPGQGLQGSVGGRSVTITSRAAALALDPEARVQLPEVSGGLECLVLVDGRYAATFRFRDEPRSDGRSFVAHLAPRHHFDRVLLVSGDRESEVRYLAEKVGIGEVHASQTPEQKLALVRAETSRAPTVFMGDGINDAPALTAATVGIAFGQVSDVTAEAASVVIMDSSIGRVDELLHIGRRMRRIALQSAVGGMAISLAAIVVAAFGYLPPVAGAITQEMIDVVAVLNALRTTAKPKVISDY